MTDSASPQASTSAGPGDDPRQHAARRAAAMFGVLLGLSLAMLAVSLGAYLAVAGRTPLAVDSQSSGVVLAVSVATSIVSLIGLLSTNLLAWRREARESRTAELQLQRQQLEIEKLRLELEKQRRET